MRLRKLLPSSLLVSSLVLSAAAASAVEVEVVVENVAPDQGVIITPAWVGFHMGQFDSYDGGVSAAGFPGLENLAEDGNTAPLSASFAEQVPMGVQSTLAGPNGPIFPGDKATFRADLNPNYHRYFSYVSMVIPSNDAFVANGNPAAHRVFDTDGEFTGFSFYILGNEVNDAGTEVNDEIPANTAALAQAAPNTGVDENGVVTDHPGFLEGGNVLAAIPNGQFTLPGYRIAKVTVRAVPTTKVRFYADGAQETTPSASAAIGACYASLNYDQDSLTVHCDHNVDAATAAHVHQAEAGTDGPVVLPFDDAASPLYQTFDVDADLVEAFFAGELYVNIHTDAYPAGEIRGQIDGCFAGPAGLCLNDGRFQVSATWTTGGEDNVARAVANTADAGFFTFFSPDNIELDVKVLDGCEENGYFWVFAAGLTDVGVELRVEDTATGMYKTYSNDQGETFETITDIQAFATCP